MFGVNWELALPSFIPKGISFGRGSALIWRYGYINDGPHERSGSGKCSSQEDVHRRKLKAEILNEAITKSGETISQT
jgi:hypothetical protein